MVGGLLLVIGLLLVVCWLRNGDWCVNSVVIVASW